MNEKSLKQIKDAAAFLAGPIAPLARGYLKSSLETALDVIFALSDGRSHTVAEIASVTGLNRNTVYLIVKALSSGGYPIRRGKGGGFTIDRYPQQTVVDGRDSTEF